MSPARLYLDNNATTRPLPEVVEAMAEHFQDAYANPGSRHAEGRRARQALEAARETVAHVLGAAPDEVVFTSSGTEASNTALFGMANGPSGTFARTAGEHPATLEPCRRLERRGWTRHVLDVDSAGRLVPEQYDTLPWNELRFVTVILAHNETGVVQDVAPLAEACTTRGIPMHIDAVQAAGKIGFDFHALNVAAASIGAHKFHGPRGIGALLVRRDVQLPPLLLGGHQEDGRRGGTEPVALAAGMAKALELWQQSREERTERLTTLRDRLEQGLRKQCPPVIVHGREATRLPNTASLAFPGVDGEALLIALDLEGVACSTGSTCASGSAEAAPVLLAMGCSEETAQSSLRFSVGIENTRDEIDEAIARIASVVTRLRNQTSARGNEVTAHGGVRHGIT